MSAETPTAVANAGPLAVVCGGGSLPVEVARAAQRQGRRVVLLALRGSADPHFVAAFPHHWVGLGQFGHACRHARAESCRDIVMIGSLVRPHVRDLRLDFFTLRVLPRVIRAFQSGDDHLLSSIAKMFEEQGFRVLGAHEVAPEILMPHGALGSRQPSEIDRRDIQRGFALLRATGPFDVGQAVIVSDNRVLAIEAADGTDLMLERLAELRGQGRVQARQGGGVLVKAPKPMQDRRIDLPSVGPRTVEGVARAGLAGIAVAAGSAIVAEPGRIAAVADRAHVFVVGVAADGPPS
jgi:UDP-2,3-diacylglucosamine hydrolase